MRHAAHGPRVWHTWCTGKNPPRFLLSSTGNNCPPNFYFLFWLLRDNPATQFNLKTHMNSRDLKAAIEKITQRGGLSNVGMWSRFILSRYQDSLSTWLFSSVMDRRENSNTSRNDSHSIYHASSMITDSVWSSIVITHMPKAFGPWGKLCFSYESSSQQPRFSLSSQLAWDL